MSGAGWWRWVGLALIGVLAALFASFNGGERVALNLGFTILYRLPLVTLIFVAFLAGMITMFLLGLRHDLRVRRALREAGFGEPMAAEEEIPAWRDDELEQTQTYLSEPPPESGGARSFSDSFDPEDSPPGTSPGLDQPPRPPP